jgi:hypothetical protein
LEIIRLARLGIEESRVVRLAVPSSARTDIEVVQLVRYFVLVNVELLQSFTLFGHLVALKKLRAKIRQTARGRSLKIQKEGDREWNVDDWVEGITERDHRAEPRE